MLECFKNARPDYSDLYVVFFYVYAVHLQPLTYSNISKNQQWGFLGMQTF